MNNKLTPKQRAKIYFKAYKYFEKKKNIGCGCCGFCDFLTYLTNKYNCEDFIEYQLFKPKKFNFY